MKSAAYSLIKNREEIARREEQQNIAKTIIEQIKAGEYLALAAWGAHTYTSYRAGENKDAGGYILGGVSFKVRTPKVLKGGHVIVYLMADDTYTVRACRCIGRNITELGKVENVYCDELVPAIDSLIENNR